MRLIAAILSSRCAKETESGVLKFWRIFERTLLFSQCGAPMNSSRIMTGRIRLLKNDDQRASWGFDGFIVADMAIEIGEALFTRVASTSAKIRQAQNELVVKNHTHSVAGYFFCNADLSLGYVRLLNAGQL